MNGLNRKFKIILIICLAIVGAFFVFSYVSAQDTFGLQPVEQNIGLAGTDIRIIIAKIIRAVLGILGIIALAIVLYGGYVYMTAGGNEEKVSQARKILINGIIGLIIILSAFAIVQFVINKLAGATGLVTEVPAACEDIDYALGHPQICGADVDFPDDCAKNHFVVKSITPRTDDTGMNNVAVRVVFSQKIQYQSGDIKIYFNGQEAVNQFNFVVLGNGAKDENALVEALYQGVSKCKDGTLCLPFGKYKVSISPEMKAQNGKTLESQTECGSYPSDGEFEIKKPSVEMFDMGDSQNYVLDFDGVDDYLAMPAMGITSGSFTLEAWINPGQGALDIFGTIMSYGYKRRILLRSNDRKLFAQFGDTVIKNFYSNGNLAVNEWSHIVYLYDAGVKKHYYYINGVYDNEDVITDSGPTWKDAFEIGRFFTTSKIWYRFYGLMDEVRIYNRALAPEEIQAHYNNGKGKKGVPGEEGLLAGWHFDEGTGATINDFSGNNKNGAINGANWKFIGAELVKDKTLPVLSDITIKNKDGTVINPMDLVKGRTYFLTSDITDNSGAGYTHLNINSTSGANLNEYDGPRVERGSDAPLSNPYKFSYPFFLPSNLASGQYTFKIEAFDIDSNSAFKELSIVVVPVNCHDGVMNGDETGIDEGGSCGSPPDTACTEDWQCASQKCVNGICVAFPVIIDVDPWDGAPGNWVTILGKYFGSSPGQIDFGYDSNGDGKFDDEDIWTQANLAACQTGDVWNNNWVIVEVPQTLLQGDKVIRLTSTNNYSVTTKDKRNVDKYFNVNDIKRPGLCSVKRTSDGAKAGSPKTAIQAIGKSFGATQGNSSLNFGNNKAGVQNWSDGLISAFVPNLSAGLVGVYVKVGNEKSNGVKFTVLKEGEEGGPIISAIDPSATTPKSYITISGSGFGSSGIVMLANPNPKNNIYLNSGFEDSLNNFSFVGYSVLSSGQPYEGKQKVILASKVKDDNNILKRYSFVTQKTHGLENGKQYEGSIFVQNLTQKSEDYHFVLIIQGKKADGTYYFYNFNNTFWETTNGEFSDDNVENILENGNLSKEFVLSDGMQWTKNVFGVKNDGFDEVNYYWGIVVDKENTNPFSFIVGIDNLEFGLLETGSKPEFCLGNQSAAGCVKLNTILPAECGTTWSDTQVIAEVPSNTVPADYYLILKNDLGQKTAGDNDKLEIISGNPLPGICKLSPASGPAPRPTSSPLKIYGINFGNSPILYFWTKNSESNNLNSWLSENTTIVEGHIETFIPVSDIGYSMQTGPIKVKVNGQLSNSIKYSVEDCKNLKTIPEGFHCCDKGPDAGVLKLGQVACQGEVREAGYVWRFATGIIPELPYVVESCDGITFPSPTPWTKWPQGKEACLNSSIAVRFSMGMNESTLNSSNIKVYKCGTAQDGGIDCDTIREELTDIAFGYESEVLIIRQVPPKGNLNQNTWYHVELSDAITSLETKQELGVDKVLTQPLKKSRPCGEGTAYCFDFKTGSGTCTLTGAGINPPSHTTNLLGVIQDSRYAFDLEHPFDPRPPAKPYYYYVWGKGSQECSVLNVDGQGWNWDSENESKATVAISPSAKPKYTDSRAKVTALANTVPDSVKITAVTTTAESLIQAESILTIDLSDPKVVEFWPNCGEACINAEIGARFNQMMVNTTYDGGIELYKCFDEFCNNKSLFSGVLTVNSELSNINTLRAYASSYLEANTWYLVELTAGIKAIGAFDEDGTIKEGKNLAPFQWKFRTKADNTPCQINTVQIIPSPFIAYFIGEKTKYMSFPHGSPDSCSPFGQTLDPWSFGWQWSTGNVNIATTTNFATGEQKLKPYCDILCLPAGSDVKKGKQISICGNGIVEAGEDCDIGITGEVATTSCGYNCLRPGNNDKGTGEKQCGNGNIDADKGEECEPISYSLSFDGSDDYVQAPSLGISSGSFSLEAWINSNLDEAGNYGTVIGYNGSHRILVQNSGLLLTQFGGNFFSQGKVKANEWSHVVYKYDSAANKEYFYINGEFDSEHTPTAVPVWNSAFKIGQYDLIHYKFHGLIDEVRVYNKALSEPDIKVHYNQGKGQKGKSGELGLVAGWHFDEGNGMLASDFSGNNKDGQLMGGTAWSNESPIVSEVTYCNDNCTNKGSSPSPPQGQTDKSWCGSGSITAGEECEGEVGCSSNCLHTGTPLSQNWCDNKTGDKPEECDKAISICGNSTVESGEECEVTDTNKIKIHGGTGEITTSVEADKICNSSCLLQNICNENITSPLKCNKDAQDCKDDCTLWGSSPNFSEPSLCGDGESGMGEYDFCEISLSADILGQNPVQAVTAVGLGQENPQTMQQETVISAKAVAFRNKAGAPEPLVNQKIGQGNYYLQCGNTENDGLVEGKYNDCVLPSGADDNAYGVGANSCCYQRSERKEEYPQDGALGVCRNTYIEVKLNSEIDSQTLDKNIILASGHEAGYNCASSTQPDQTAQINSLLLTKADAQPTGFWQKIWQTVKHFFAGLFGQKATATLYQPSSAVWCGSEKDVRAEMHYASPTSTISIYINNLLEPNREYAVILKSGQKGLKDARGVGIKNKDSDDKLDDIWFFKTGNQVCKLQAIKVFPDSYWFKKPDAVKDFQAITKSNNGQMIVTTTAYSWNWHWAPAENPVFAIPITGKPDDADWVTIGSRNIEGTIKAVAQAKVIIDKDSQNNQLGKVFTGTSDLLAKFCENPWPSPADEDDDWVPYTDNFYNFSMSYCADAGKSGNIADDLPFLNDEIISTVKTEDSLKKILFFNSQNDDVFGVQILENPKRLSALAWFKDKFPNAPSPQQLTIAGYDAVQNGDNYYINGLNLVNVGGSYNLYNNIYLFSLNKGAQADSKKMLEQILQSLQFNINITNHGYCLNSGATLSADPNDINDQYICQTDFECLDINGSVKPGASGVCSNAKTKFFRDLKRLSDMQKAQAQLTAYYNKNSKYPDLKSGTYIPGYTVSKWPSWGKLGSAIGGLPLEPVNYWAGCGANMLPAGIISWWKANGDANDTLGRSNGTASEVVKYATGKAGQAFSFDGVDGYVSIIDGDDPVSYTIAAWVKPDKVAPMNIFVRTSAAGPGIAWSHQLRINAAGKFEHYVFANNMLSVSSTLIASPDSWYHVAGVAANNGALKLYINGIEEGNTVNIGTLWTGGDRYYIGSSSTGMSYFSGLIDEITLYDRALSPTEIQSLYNYGNYGENNSDIDQQTCWNAKQSVYVCPYAANVYEYEFNKTSGDYLIHGPLEYFNENDAVADAFLDTGHFTTNRWCSSGQVFSPFGEKCGDGIVQTSKGEDCDPPGATKLVSSYNDSSGTLVNCPANQKATATCASNCAWAYGQCEKIGVCGNGLVEGDEDCDDGNALNGTYGHCNGDCTDQFGLFCGNRQLDSQNGKPLEFCEQLTENQVVVDLTDKKFRLVCNPYLWNFNLDGVLNSICINSEDVAACKILFGFVFSPIELVKEKCFYTKHCSGNPAILCDADSDCEAVPSYNDKFELNSGNTQDFSTFLDNLSGQGFTDEDSCVQDHWGSAYYIKKENSCSWDCQNYGEYCGDGKKHISEQCDDGNTNDNDNCQNNCTIKTTPTFICGNGQKEADEECDDGNTKNNDGCSSVCKNEVGTCGNSAVDADQGEICDTGVNNNGVKCLPSYGKSCVWCSADCKKKYTVDAAGFCGNGKIDIVTSSAIGLPLIEACDSSNNEVVIGTWQTGGFPPSAEIVESKPLCSDKGKYECLNNCAELKNNCVTCGVKSNAEGGVPPKIALLNPMIGKGIKWPYSGLEMVGLYTTSSAPSNLGYKTLISSFESGEQQILTGVSIESSPLCKEEYKVHFNYPDIFNFLHPPSGFINLLQFNNDWNEIKPYGDVFPYPVNGESNSIENEIIMMPTMIDTQIRVVVRWTDKEDNQGKGAPFQGLVYSDDFDKSGDTTSTISYFTAKGENNICSVIASGGTSWFPIECKPYNIVSVHDLMHLEKTFAQSFTIFIGNVSYEKPIAFFVQNMNGPIAKYKNSKLQVEIYTNHPNQTKYSVYLPTQTFNIIAAAGTSSNPLARYWHVFNLERENGNYVVKSVEKIETDFCQVLSNMLNTEQCVTGQ